MRKTDAAPGSERHTEQQAPKPPPAENAGKPKRGPSKSRVQSWAKIDGGKGTWKPR